MPRNDLQYGRSRRAQQPERDSAVILRTPVSLRIPPMIAEQVEAYAAEHGMSKTDAYVFFLQAGLDQLHAQDAEAATQTSLALLHEQMADVLNLLKGEPDAGSAEKLESEEVQRIIADTAAAYPAIARARLFGSFARGDFNDDSDVDVRIELDPAAAFNLRDLSRFCKAIEKQTGRSVDIVSAAEIKNPSLALAIERDGVLVFER